MQELRGRVAVVTGAGSGIGRGLAERFAAEGMKVVLADVQADALEEATAAITKTGAEAVGVRTDVSDASAVEALANKAYATYGAVHVLCNNAGVAAAGGQPTWEATAADWQWVLGVNLFGVINGVHSFVPRMLAAGEEGHVVNTASVLGLMSGPAGAPYGVSKHGVVRLTEGLYYDLQARNAKIAASVLCPGLVSTRITESERNRPASLANPEPVSESTGARRLQVLHYFSSFGMAPADVATRVVQGIHEQRFYILTHPDVKARVRARLDDIYNERNPTPPATAGVPRT